MVRSTHNQPSVKSSAFKYSLIATAIVGMSSASLAAQETQTTQEPDENSLEVIDVKGTRGAIINAQNMRREADTLLDALSASDIGALPDRSILEAIQRVPGVTIGRFAAANDPDHFGTEGSGLVVRGLTQVRSEFNGRDTFTANSGRSLSFEDIPPELIGGVEVFKNQTADMVEGGIAGTVNLVTKKPFDNGGGRKISVAADATYADFIEETTPSFFGLYSDTVETDMGRFGWLFNYSQSELKAQSDGAQIGVLDTHAEFDNQLVPRSTRLTRKKDDRDRKGFASVLQFESSDGTFKATAEFIRSESSLAWTENAIEWGDDDYIGITQPANGTEFEFDDNGIFQDGYITTNAGWRGADSERQPGGQYGPVHAMVTRARDDKSAVQDINFNVEFVPNEDWAFNFDYQRVTADTQIQDFQVQGGTAIVPRLNLVNGDAPQIELRNPNFANGGESPSDGNYFTDPRFSYWRAAMDHVSDNEGEQSSYRFDAKRSFSDGFITSVSAGVRYADREQTSRESAYNWGALSIPWSGNPDTMVWFDDERTDLATEIVSFENFGRGGILDIEGGNNVIFPAVSVAQNYRESITGLREIAVLGDAGGNEWFPLATRTNNGRSPIPGSDFAANEVNETAEESTAFYVKANFEGELDNGMFYSSNFGLRYVKIENDTFGFNFFPGDVVASTGPDDNNRLLPEDQQAFGNGAITANTDSSSYTNLLPSFNMKLEVSEDVLVRIGISEAIALPQLGLLRNTTTIRGEDRINVRGEPANPGDEPPLISTSYGRYVGDAGNPLLKPMESFNYDLTVEWYFAEDGSFTASLFYKDLKNYFISGSVDRQFTNNGATQLVQLNTSTNGDEGSIQGFELAYTDYFKNLPEGLDGLGTQLNYTYVSEEGSPNSSLTPDNPGSPVSAAPSFEGLPLEGLSKHTFNAALLYQKYGVDARIAYNWRSEYLLTTRDVITALPIFSKAAGFLDASAFYNVTENVQVGLQMSNLLDTESVTRMQINQAGDQVTRGVFVNDRRFSFILRGNF